MLKQVAIAVTLVLANAVPLLAETPATTAAQTKPVYSTAETTLGVLLDDAAAKVIIDKHIPGLTDNPSISMAAGMTLKALQAMAGDKITDEMLKAVDSDFKALQSSK
jgi:para-nitrobenzyl esterase